MLDPQKLLFMDYKMNCSTKVTFNCCYYLATVLPQLCTVPCRSIDRLLQNKLFWLEKTNHHKCQKTKTAHRLGKPHYHQETQWQHNVLFCSRAGEAVQS